MLGVENHSFVYLDDHEDVVSIIQTARWCISLPDGRMEPRRKDDVVTTHAVWFEPQDERGGGREQDDASATFL